MKLLEKFESFTIDKIPQKDNRHADVIASATSLISPHDPSTYFTFVIHPIMKPSIDTCLEDILTTTQEASREWYDTIYNYLKDGTIPEPTTTNTQNNLLKLVAKYMIFADVLYRRSLNGLLLRCLRDSEIPTALEQAHAGSCGGHFGGWSLVQKLIHMGYYWRHMEKYFFAYKCQEHSNLIHDSIFDLRAQIPIWTFSVWGLDLIGKISPPSSFGHTFIITAIDHFTKWVEDIPLRSTKAEVIFYFILEHIIACFGDSSAIILDNGTPFKNNEVKKFLVTFNIQH